MARGGYRPGAGRPKGARSQPKAERPLRGKRSPLDYMLAVMNDADADPTRRDRMAIAAAPYVHAKADALGKKEKAAAAAHEPPPSEWAHLDAPWSPDEPLAQ
jgi:hypothetical protein